MKADDRPVTAVTQSQLAALIESTKAKIQQRRRCHAERDFLQRKLRAMVALRIAMEIKGVQRT